MQVWAISWSSLSSQVARHPLGPQKAVRVYVSSPLEYEHDVLPRALAAESRFQTAHQLTQEEEHEPQPSPGKDSEQC